MTTNGLFHYAICTVCIILFYCNISYSQKSLLLYIKLPDSTSKHFIRETTFEGIQDSVSVVRQCSRLISQLNEIGFLAASMDSLTSDSSIFTAFIDPGSKYLTGTINVEDIDQVVLRKNGLNPERMKGKPLNYTKIAKIREKIVAHYENNGYPFASVHFDSVQFIENNFCAKLVLEKGMAVRIDSVHLKGDVPISPVFLTKYLGIPPGGLYNEQRISRISTHISELPFLAEIKPVEVRFTEEKADVFLYLKKNKANRFNGILGVLPDNKVAGRVLVTGEVELFLLNSLSKGESFSLNWQKLDVQTQKLLAKLNYPYLLKTPFGTDIQFDLYKKDTSYVTVNFVGAIQYLLSGGNYVKVYMNRKKSSLLSTGWVGAVGILPEYADIKTALYGIGYNLEVLDYRFNPRKGYALVADISFGQKKIQKNSALDEAVYDGIPLSSNQLEISGTLLGFIPLADRMTLLIRNQSGHLNNENLFENELFRIGGLRTIRGVDEESLTVSSYSITTIEYRFLFEKNSNAYVFIDGAWYEKNMPNSFLSDTPIGFGLGISLETKAGIFTINYALAKQFDNPLEIRSAKVHFGYLNRF